MMALRTWRVAVGLALIGSKRYIIRQASTARLAEADNPRHGCWLASAGNLRKSRFEPPRRRVEATGLCHCRHPDGGVGALIDTPSARLLAQWSLRARFLAGRLR